MSEGERERDRGMGRAYRAANPAWKAFMYECIVVVARRKQYFTTDDVETRRVRIGGPTTHENRALGPLMRQAHRDGICYPTERFEPSRRAMEHARPLRVWQSLVFNR